MLIKEVHHHSGDRRMHVGSHTLVMPPLVTDLCRHDRACPELTQQLGRPHSRWTVPPAKHQRRTDGDLG